LWERYGEALAGFELLERQVMGFASVSSSVMS
jgi:hypothetical protein